MFLILFTLTTLQSFFFKRSIISENHCAKHNLAVNDHWTGLCTGDFFFEGFKDTSLGGMVWRNSFRSSFEYFSRTILTAKEKNEIW